MIFFSEFFDAENDDIKIGTNEFRDSKQSLILLKLCNLFEDFWVFLKWIFNCLYDFICSNPNASSSVSSTSSSSGTIEQMKAGLANMSNLFPEINGDISKEVEDEANKYFQRIYVQPHPTMTIDEVLDLLKKFQESTVKRDREVFICMIKNLFEEYKYFPQYPEYELKITAQLFGGVIEHGLVTMIPLGLALR